MSGTSLDGVDYVLCEITGSQIKLKKLWSFPYPKQLRKKLLAAATDRLSSYETANLHHELGRFYAHKAPSVPCRYVGLHGQTVYHNPVKNKGATYQLGEPSYLAAKLDVSVINQFRTMDLALGGQGAPLATLFHKTVFGRQGKNVAVNNLGGISNVTFLPKKPTGKIFSFDTGPGNMLIDQAMRHISGGRKEIDTEGAFARRGVVFPSLPEKWLQHEFFSLKPPKSTGREDFGEKFFNRVWSDCKNLGLNHFDTVATLTAFTAESIADSYERFLPSAPDTVVLCGGGAANRTLVKMIDRSLNQRLKKSRSIEVVTSDLLGWPHQSVEPAAFAFLAYRTMNKLSGNIPQTTGARRSAVLGQITPSP